MKSTTKYQLIIDLLGDKPNATSIELFDTYEQVKDYWKKNYRDRNKNDGHDEYWCKTPFIFQIINTTIVIGFDNGLD